MPVTFCHILLALNATFIVTLSVLLFVFREPISNAFRIGRKLCEGIGSNNNKKKDKLDIKSVLSAYDSREECPPSLEKKGNNNDKPAGKRIKFTKQT